MKSIRLLPVVVMAVAAVLVLKTVGLVTNGGYVLAGVTTARAAGDAGGHGAAPASAEGDTGVTFPPEPTLTDLSPVLADSAPTLGQTDAEGGHGAAPAEAGHGEAPAAEEGHGEAPAAEEGHGEPAVTEVAQAEAGHGEAAPAAEAAHEAGEPVAAAEGETAALDPNCLDVEYVTTNILKPEEPGHVAPAEAGDEAIMGTPVDPNCPQVDAVPVRVDAEGNRVPVADGQSGATDRVLLERLAERRNELQNYDEELALRASLVDAAEKRLEERTATLQALESQIAALVDQQSAMEGEQFAGIVAMYEAMKPKDAAAIFNTLEMDVLLRVAKSISSRKMAPIMAAMSAERAQELTVAMATIVTNPPEEMTANDLASLPQIVGQ